MRLSTFALGTALLAAPWVSAVAQTAATVTAPAMVSPADRAYLADAAQGSAYELRLAQTAAQSAKRDDVRAFAARLVHDHGAYSAALGRLAQAKGVTLPAEMKDADRTRFAAMSPYTDDAFVNEAIRINAEDKKTSAAEAARTQDADIKAFLKQFEAADMEHERMALMLRK